MKDLLESLQEQSPHNITFTTQVQLWDASVDITGMHSAQGTPCKLQPDQYKAYVEFRLAHAFPVVSTKLTSLHPSTLWNSYRSMLHQQFNYGHLVKEYYKDRKEDVREDRILGAIIAVEFPREPMGGWTLTDAENAPGMHCIATIAKQAKGMDRVLGQHKTGREPWTVSLELDYNMNESGVVMVPVQQGQLGGRERENALTSGEKQLLAKHTPRDYLKAGISYLPLIEASEELVSCFNLDKGIWTKPYKGHNLITLMGGIDGNVSFKGTGLVSYGAEPAARIEQILAEDSESAAFSNSLNRLGELLDRFA
jgi:hypothetical protein